MLPWLFFRSGTWSVDPFLHILSVPRMMSIIKFIPKYYNVDIITPYVNLKKDPQPHYFSIQLIWYMHYVIWGDLGLKLINLKSCEFHTVHNFKFLTLIFALDLNLGLLSVFQLTNGQAVVSAGLIILYLVRFL